MHKMNIRKITIIYTVSVPLLLTDSSSTFGFVVSVGKKNTVRTIKTRNIQYHSTYFSTTSSNSSYKRHSCFPIANSSSSSSSRDNDKDASLDSQPTTHHQQEEEQEQEDVGVLENYEFVPIQDGEISDDLIREKLEGAPSELEILKELLGINAFTYILACLIAFFLGMNLLLGPGWLGQLAGLEGRGTFTEISDSLPDSVDLSRPEFLLLDE